MGHIQYYSRSLTSSVLSETVMRFFRRDRRLVVLALFALAAQLVLSFAHIHVHAAHRYADATTAGSCAITASSHCPSHDDDDALCSICWTMNIAGSLVLPEPVALDLPSLESDTLEAQPSVASFSGNETIQFQARAPPFVEVAS
jgi:hypothetical protein